MNFGDNISLNTESMVLDILVKMINILRNTRKENVGEFEGDVESIVKKKINVYENSLVLDNWAFKVITVKTSNLQRSGVFTFYNSNFSKKRRVICIFNNISKRAYIELIMSPGIEVFTYTDIIQYPLNNIMQPDFFLLGEEERKKMIEEFNVLEKNLPKIKVSDIISRFFNAKVNDIFKIVRKTPEYGYDIYYRIVIPSNYDDMFDV